MNLLIAEATGIKGAQSSDNSYNDVIRLCRDAQKSGIAEGSLDRTGLANRVLGEAMRRLGRKSQAADSYRRAFASFQTTGSESGMAWTLWSFANLSRQCGDFPKAFDFLARAKSLAAETNEMQLRLYIFAGIAETNRIIGNTAVAHRQHRKLLHIFSRNEDARGVIWALEGIGQMKRYSRDFIGACEVFSAAKKMARRSGDLRGLAYACKCHAENLGDLGHLLAAKEELDHSIAMFSALKLVTGLAYSVKSVGDLFRRADKLDFAVAPYGIATEMFRNQEDLRGEAYTILAYADFYRRCGDRAAARHELDRATVLFRKLGVRLGTEECARLEVQIGQRPCAR
jgi:tetratricopeptide (TPR) repeat protein